MTVPGGLSAERHRDVILTSAAEAQVNGFRFTLGAHDRLGRFLGSFAHRRRGHVTGQPPAPQVVPEARWTGRHIYAGVLFGQFGHFVTESLSRLWALSERPGAALVWHRHPDHRQPGLARWQEQVLEAAGAGGRTHRIVDAPVLVEDILVPEQGHILGERHHPSLDAVIARHRFHKPVPGRRVWLSRSLLTREGGGGLVEGEAELEALLRAEGWEVLHPERLPVPAQLAACEQAEVIAGFAGSAFHLLLLGYGVRARVVLLDRGLGPDLRRNYDVIAAAKGFRQDVLEVPLTLAGGAGHTGRWRLRDPAAAAALVHAAAGGLDSGAAAS